MTWVVGGAGYWSPFIVGDIRITWPSGDVEDCLQKVYPLAQNILGGFAGSVEIGLRLLGEIGEQANQVRSLHEMAHTWLPNLMRQRFNEARDEDSANGSQFLLVGYDPERQGSPHRLAGQVFRFRSPHFEPESVQGDRCLGIGSGDSVEKFRLAVEAAYGESSKELANIDRPHLLPFLMADRLHQLLQKEPQAEVSKWFVYGTNTPQGSPIWPLTYYAVDEQGEELVAAPSLIRSYDELVKLAEERGFPAEGSIA